MTRRNQRETGKQSDAAQFWAILGGQNCAAMGLEGLPNASTILGSKVHMTTSTASVRKFVFVSALVWLFFARTVGAQEVNPTTEIEQLKRHVAEQDERIAQLEKQVQTLIAATKPSAASPHAASETSAIVSSARSPQPSTQTVSLASESSSASSPNVATTAGAQMKTSSASSTSSVAPARSTPAESKIKVAGIDVGGDVYLYQYVPFGVRGSQPKFELYAFSVKLRSQKGPWEFYSDYRFRTTKLRSFFPGSTWLQEGYVGYRTRFGEIKAGSFYRHVGLVWDDSFFGNIQYFDGLKLDPEFGVGLEGSHKISSRLSAEYSTQYFSTDARVNGSLPGRDFISEPGARIKNDGAFRFAPVWHFNDDTSLTVGGSYARGTIERDGGPNNARWQYAADATFQWKGLLTYGELLTQKVERPVIEPPQDATYTLFGARWARGRFQPRFNYSAGNYHGFNPRREYILQPGITVNMYDGFYFIYEFDYWKETSVLNPFLLDKSLNFVLLYHF